MKKLIILLCGVFLLGCQTTTRVALTGEKEEIIRCIYEWALYRQVCINLLMDKYNLTQQQAEKLLKQRVDASWKKNQEEVYKRLQELENTK